MSRVGARVNELTAEADDAAPSGPITVRGWVPGPAGAASLDVLDGRAVLELDVAEPDLLVSLRLLDPVDGRAQRLARILLGPTAAAATAHAHRAAGRPVVVWERLEDRVRPLRGRGTSPGGLGLVGRLGLGMAELSVAGRTDAAIAVGLVEAGVAAQDLRTDLSPTPNSTTLLRAGVAHWDALPPASLDAIADLLAEQQGRWLKATHGADPDLAERLRLLLGRDLRLRPPAAGRADRSSSFEPELLAFGPVDAIEGSADALTAAPMASAAGLAATAAGGSAPSPKQRPDLPVAFDAVLGAGGARVVRTERLDHHLVIHLGGLPDGGPPPWLRVFADDPGGPVPLALAPVPDGGRPWRTAVALVPVAVPDHDLLIDVTVSPKTPPHAPTERAIAAAAHLGAEAARAWRRGDPDASSRWRDAAAAWAALGDDRRADLADEYTSSAPRIDPLLADLL